MNQYGWLVCTFFVKVKNRQAKYKNTTIHKRLLKWGKCEIDCFFLHYNRLKCIMYRLAFVWVRFSIQNGDRRYHCQFVSKIYTSFAPCTGTRIEKQLTHLSSQHTCTLSNQKRKKKNSFFSIVVAIRRQNKQM